MIEDKKTIAIKVLDDINLRTIDVIASLGKVFNGASNCQDYRILNEFGSDTIKQLNRISSRICKVHLDLIELQNCIKTTRESIVQDKLDI